MNKLKNRVQSGQLWLSRISGETIQTDFNNKIVPNYNYKGKTWTMDFLVFYNFCNISADDRTWHPWIGQICAIQPIFCWLFGASQIYRTPNVRLTVFTWRGLCVLDCPHNTEYQADKPIIHNLLVVFVLFPPGAHARAYLISVLCLLLWKHSKHKLLRFTSIYIGFRATPTTK